MLFTVDYCMTLATGACLFWRDFFSRLREARTSLREVNSLILKRSTEKNISTLNIFIVKLLFNSNAKKEKLVYLNWGRIKLQSLSLF